MVLLSASVCTKSGKPIVSRQFVEMTRSRVEGLLAGFPKLIKEGKQHTFVETDTVRYVYQPLDLLYIVLITTKNSNILEDLETLRMFAKVIPEYCRTLEERDVADHVFELIFAFDEIVALGYRESVNLSQIRTFTEMDSHEEMVHIMQQRNKEREAKEHLKLKMKELEREKRNAMRQGRPPAGGGFGSASFGGMGTPGMGGGMGGVSIPQGISSSSSYGSMSSSGQNSPGISSANSTAFSSKPASSAPVSRGMKIGGKPKTNELVDALIADGELVQQDAAPALGGARLGGSAGAKAAAAAAPAVPTEAVHVRIEEKIVVRAKRDLGLENMEVKGDLFLRVADPALPAIAVQLSLPDEKSFQFKTHPNVDKKLFTDQSLVALKDPSKPWPPNAELGVLKWRMTTTDDRQLPLSVNCWPQPNPDGSCDVNIEYELNNTALQLQDVVIAIPVASNRSAPVVASVDGSYDFDVKSSKLYWSIPVVDSSNATGSMEFKTATGNANSFFPVSVGFSSTQTFANFQINGAVISTNQSPIKFSAATTFGVESYDFV
ncbi:coatomer subunit delta [Capsaspora owczarzaki ATCC 30864]|uniref:Coatomer subunit delta n=1 Tax=Capsaspora owczarzaki (strain ATCC 30864) TaxID=595528 RepID=A0A0D2X2B2_CAPO3|nr:coatomer subunit delta [Capsaspora owczarzaki ATCC 30864]KJE92254.1 coatomer subunit delta [Capsaspora owczarzaki ATCC 30864]|eukprot:XP_004364098.2 coatomer subunit delta [Capsaspora owczarzaki ATCC 30864]